MKMTADDIRKLVTSLDASGLDELRYKDEDGELVLKKHTPVSAPDPVLQANPEAAPTAQEDRSQAAPAELSDSSDGADDGLIHINSEIAGVFYRASRPGEAPFTKVGSQVKKGDTVALMEAMKMMSEVTSPVDGEVVSIDAEDGRYAQYGTCLMKIREKSHV